MIGFWITAMVLTIGAVALVILPLLRRGAAPSQGGTDLAVYRDQLTELESERTRGLIEADQANAMEAEIGRRMLAAARSADAAKILPAASPSRGLAIALGLAIPVAALGIYLVTGHPEMPSMPLAGRTIAPDDEDVRVLAQANQMKATLKPTKDFVDKWLLLGRVYMKLGKLNESVDAFRTAVTIEPNEPIYITMLGEALVQAENGTVGEEARQRFASVPKDAGESSFEARYYLALADDQAGKTVEAMKGWQSLLMDSPADAPWIDTTRAQLAQAALKLGLNPMQVIPKLKPPAAAPSVAEGAPGPNQAQVDAASKMTPEQRTQMIQGMVAKLATELEGKPDDAAGWRRLANAYQVLGEQEKAKSALARAEAAEKKAGTVPAAK